MPVADDHPLRDLPDRAMRESLRHPDNLRALLRQVVPALAEGFDCTRARLLERDFPLEDWLQMMAVLRAEDEAPATFEEVFRKSIALLKELQGKDEVRWYDLMRIILTWAAWRRPRHEWAALQTVASASESDTARKMELE